MCVTGITVTGITVCSSLFSLTRKVARIYQKNAALYKRHYVEVSSSKFFEQVTGPANGGSRRRAPAARNSGDLPSYLPVWTSTLSSSRSKSKKEPSKCITYSVAFLSYSTVSVAYWPALVTSSTQWIGHSFASF